MSSIEPGGQIHRVNPFADPEEARSPLRRFRGRLPAAVTLWTTPGPVGLTVASTLIVDGDPGLVFGTLDPDSDLYEATTETGVFTVQVLTPTHQSLADRFGGVDPAPGGLFRGGEHWRDTAWGPVLRDVSTWCGCRYVASRDAGWSQLVEGVVEEVDVGSDVSLLYHRGRYHRLDLT
ncbi:MAG: flavin reductase family protein, partial [Micromonosporaceae bacterium]